MPRGDDAAANEDRPPLAPDVVRHPAARQGQQIDERRVQAVDRRRLFGAKAEPRVRRCRAGRGRHKQDEERPQPVVAKPLPQLRKKERGEAARVPEEIPPTGHGRGLSPRRRPGASILHRLVGRGTAGCHLWPRNQSEKRVGGRKGVNWTVTGSVRTLGI